MFITDKPKGIFCYDDYLLINTVKGLSILNNNFDLIEQRNYIELEDTKQFYNVFYLYKNKQYFKYKNIITNEMADSSFESEQKIIYICDTDENQYKIFLKNKKEVCIESKNDQYILTVAKNNKITFFNNYIYFYDDKMIKEFNIKTKEKIDIIKIEKLKTFTVKNEFIVYAEGPRVYIYNKKTKNRREYHTHAHNVNKLFIDHNNLCVFSVCKQKVVQFELATEKKIIFNIDNYSVMDIKFTNKNIFILTKMDIHIFDRLKNKIIKNLIYLDNKHKYKGILDCESEFVEEETDLFKDTKKESKTKLEVQNFTEKNFDKLDVFEKNKKLFFYNVEELVKQFTFGKGYATSFIKEKKIFVFSDKQKVSKRLKNYTLTIYNNNFSEELKMRIKNIKGNPINCLKIDDTIYVLTKKILYKCTSGGLMISITKKLNG